MKEPSLKGTFIQTVIMFIVMAFIFYLIYLSVQGHLWPRVVLGALGFILTFLFVWGIAYMQQSLNYTRISMLKCSKKDKK